MLKDSDAKVRKHAADALGDLGPAARTARPALQEALTDPEATVRSAVAAALDKVAPASDARPPQAPGPRPQDIRLIAFDDSVNMVRHQGPEESDEAFVRRTGCYGQRQEVVKAWPITQFDHDMRYLEGLQRVCRSKRDYNESQIDPNSVTAGAYRAAMRLYDNKLRAIEAEITSLRANPPR